MTERARMREIYTAAWKSAHPEEAAFPIVLDNDPAMIAMALYAAEREAAEREACAKRLRQLEDICHAANSFIGLARLKLQEGDAALALGFLDDFCEESDRIEVRYLGVERASKLLESGIIHPTPAFAKEIDALRSRPEASAPQPMAGEWIEWNGGECPAIGKIVEVKFRDNKRDIGLDLAQYWRWDHGLDDSLYCANDIIAYRLVPSQPDTGTKDWERVPMDAGLFCDMIALIGSEIHDANAVLNVVERLALQRLSKGSMMFTHRPEHVCSRCPMRGCAMTSALAASIICKSVA